VGGAGEVGGVGWQGAERGSTSTSFCARNASDSRSSILDCAPSSTSVWRSRDLSIWGSVFWILESANRSRRRPKPRVLSLNAFRSLALTLAVVSRRSSTTAIIYISLVAAVELPNRRLHLQDTKEFCKNPTLLRIYFIVLKIFRVYSLLEVTKFYCN